MGKLSKENLKLDTKSKSNKKAALLLSNAGIFHAAVSRLYYSVYQKSLCYQKEFCSYMERDNVGSSHVALIDTIDIHIKELMREEKYKLEAMRSIKYKARINDLKEARVKSDYKAIDEFTEEEYEVYHNSFKEVSEALGHYRTILEKR